MQSIWNLDKNLDSIILDNVRFLAWDLYYLYWSKKNLNNNSLKATITIFKCLNWILVDKLTFIKEKKREWSNSIESRFFFIEIFYEFFMKRRILFYFFFRAKKISLLMDDCVIDEVTGHKFETFWLIVRKIKL